MVIEAIGRPLRLAVIGGGPGSVIGEVHRIAARLDGYYEIVASTLSSDPERSRRAGIAIGVAEDRTYPSARELIENESKRTDRADVIAVMTPPTVTTRSAHWRWLPDFIWSAISR